MHVGLSGCVLLTAIHCGLRLTWSREHALWTPQQWSCVMFSDESRFSLQSDSRRTLIWRAPGTRYHQKNTIERHHYGVSEWLVWGRIILGSRTDLHVQSATMTGHIYRDVFLEQHVRLFRGVMGAEFLFMDDNARPHRANIVDECLQSEDITHMDCPAYSPDLNPIEHVWDMLGLRIAARQPPPTCLPELRRALLDEWCNIPLYQTDNLILSLPRRCFAFASLDAASDFEEQRMRFFRENERYDEYMEMREGLDLLGVDFQEYMITFAGKDKLPWYVSQATFWVFSLLLLSWPLRVVIDSQTAYVHYQVTKLFGSNPAAPSNTRENQMSRNSTADSVEMERLIENQLNYAPSYSEAVLYDSSYPFSSSLESGLHMDTFNQLPSNHRPPRRPSTSRSEDRELIAPGCSRIPKSISQPFKPFQENGRPNFNHRPTPRCSRETPPCYDEALLYSYPLVRYMNLRRSATDRDLSTFRPLRTSWSSLFHWMKRNNETDL
ncbi:transmembrane protein 151B [Trichonephila clavipes]|uniref:Transmembrane protein 151B n=1 Tax=Trichonephila clavipes TaxID=2585209 RepID=A0A8X6VAQ1_TRICX|nr:transmembrane protein 151B [Trichonephila clavipes]